MHTLKKFNNITTNLNASKLNSHELNCCCKYTNIEQKRKYFFHHLLKILIKLIYRLVVAFLDKYFQVIAVLLCLFCSLSTGTSNLYRKVQSNFDYLEKVYQQVILEIRGTKNLAEFTMFRYRFELPVDYKDQNYHNKTSIKVKIQMPPPEVYIH